jgi:hypothetical protein
LQERNRQAGAEFREFIAAAIASDPITYSEAILGKSPEEYSQ